MFLNSNKSYFKYKTLFNKFNGLLLTKLLKKLNASNVFLTQIVLKF